MSNQLVATIVKYGSQLVESYKRKTKASEAELIDQGLEPTEENLAVVGIAAIKEYVVFQTTNILKNQTKTFALSRWGEDLKFESIYVENSNSDYFWIEIVDTNNNIIIKQYIYRNRSPVEFPSNPIPPDIKIRIRALQDITFVRLTAVPCKILDTFFAEEDYAQQTQPRG